MANKSAFIRSLPRSMPAAEVVKKGKAAGMTFSDKYVYTIRSKGPKVGKRGRPKGSGKGARSSNGGNLPQQFLDLAIDLGLSRAEAILVRLRSAIRAAAVG